MLDKYTSGEKPISVVSDLTLCDIDIDFELNDGRGAWVVILRKEGHPPQPLPEIDNN
jgi:hypothetical protein